MRRKTAALIIAVFLILSISATAYALGQPSIFDVLDIVGDISVDKYNKYSEQEWHDMTPQERSDAFAFAVNGNRGTLNGYGSSIIQDGTVINPSDTFFSDPNYDVSFARYNVLTGQGIVTPEVRLLTMMCLENESIADFGMGYYPDNNLSYIDGTVADTLNDEFVDYVKKVPYATTDDSSGYKFDNGYYITWEPLFQSKGSTNFSFNNGEIHSKSWYKLRFYLHDTTGKIIDMRNGNIISCICDVCQDEPFANFTITQKGTYCCDIYYSQHVHIAVAETKEEPIPWYSDYGIPEEIVPIDGAPAVGVDENGNKIDLTLNSDGVTFDGNTYNYNDDNSVTINGNKYNISVNPNNVDENYYNQFLTTTLNNYYNYYTSSSTNNFDGTDILSALKSIFTSLESFRTSAYTSFRQLCDYVRSVASTVSSSCNKIVKAIESIGISSSDLTDEELYNYQNRLNAAVNGIFAPVISLKDLVEKALNIYKSSSTSSIDFTLSGKPYKIDFAKFFNEETLSSFRFLLAAYIYVSYALNTFRRLPSYISTGGDK